MSLVLARRAVADLVGTAFLVAAHHRRCAGGGLWLGEVIATLGLLLVVFNIAPSSVPMFVLIQLIGGALGLGLITLLYPGAARVADDLVDELLPDAQRHTERPNHG